MWNERHSLFLTIVCTWAAIALVAALAVFVPMSPRLVARAGTVLFDIVRLEHILPSFYGCCAAVLAALIALLRMLRDIRKGQVFTAANVRRLRVISWCVCAVCLILVATALVFGSSPALLMIAAAALFFFLLLRVIKNTIDAARLLKEESDFTI